MGKAHSWLNGGTIIVKNKKQFDYELSKLSSMATHQGLARDEIASVLVKFINKEEPIENLNYDEEKLRHLNEKGYVEVDNLFSETELQEIKDFLNTKDVCNQHVPPGQKRFKLENSDNRFNSYFIEDLVKCPHLLRACLKEDIINLAESYLGCAPTLYSINVFWMLKEFTGCSEGPNVVSGIQKFHRDHDDYKFLCFFVYLTDVNNSSAPHLFVEGSHKTKGSSYDVNKIKKFTRSAGTTVAEDTYGLHSGGLGTEELKNDRLLLWFRFGLHKNNPTKIQLPTPFCKSEVNCNGINFNKKIKFITRFFINHWSNE